MLKTTPEQRILIKHRAIQLGFPRYIALRICLNAVIDDSIQSLINISSAPDFLCTAFDWSSSPEGYSFWCDIQTQTVGRESSPSPATSETHQELIQGEVQQLLHILREQLEFTTDMKKHYKSVAANHWSFAEPTEDYGQSAFNDHSSARKQHKYWKQQESKLVNLITKLKGMR